MSDIRYPAVGEIWTYVPKDSQHKCVFADSKGFVFENADDEHRFILSQWDWQKQYNKDSWRSPKRISDVLCFYVTPSKTIKATFYGDKNAVGKPYYLELFDDGSLNVREA